MNVVPFQVFPVFEQEFFKSYYQARKNTIWFWSNFYQMILEIILQWRHTYKRGGHNRGELPIENCFQCWEGDYFSLKSDKHFHWQKKGRTSFLLSISSTFYARIFRMKVRSFSLVMFWLWRKDFGNGKKALSYKKRESKMLMKLTPGQ